MQRQACLEHRADIPFRGTEQAAVTGSGKTIGFLLSSTRLIAMQITGVSKYTHVSVSVDTEETDPSCQCSGPDRAGSSTCRGPAHFLIRGAASPSSWGTWLCTDEDTGRKPRLHTEGHASGQVGAAAPTAAGETAQRGISHTQHYYTDIWRSRIQFFCN